MHRRAVVVGVGVALSTQVALGAVAAPTTDVPEDHTGHDHVHVLTDADAPAPVALPASDPARGIVTAGLRVPRSGPCLGLFEIADEPEGSLRCTHGPDAAPEDGRDVRSKQLEAAESRRIVASAPTFACDGDGQAGRRAHAIYAHAPDRTDRFSTYEATFRAIIADVQDQVRQSSIAHGATDPLVYRFTHTTPSGGSCEPLIDNVDLPSTTDDDTFGATVNALEAMGYTRSDRRYLVFVDANVLCGIGHLYGDDRSSPASNWNNVLYQPLFSRVDAGCWNYAETHELFHNIGAVQNSAPNSSGAGHCNDNYDLMCYADGGPTSSMVTRCTDSGWEQRLDCGGDDYFNPSPPSGSYLDGHWNTADSGWLFVETAGAGGGGTGGGDAGGGSGGSGGGGGTTAPSVAFTGPSSGASVTPPFTVSGTASDVDGDLDRVVIRVDGSYLRTLAVSGGRWSTSIDVEKGPTTITAVAYDAGGRKTSVSRSFTAGWPDLFRDDDDSVFEGDINTIAGEGVTRGCNPPANDFYCPDAVVTRGQMAAFLARALALPTGSVSFDDTVDSPFRSDIARLAQAGITRGCNPPANTSFCPERPVTRGQMAAFLARALGLPGSSITFDDTADSPFRSDIARLAQAGITRGCDPPANTSFCPERVVTRGQMAAFLNRALY